MAFPIPHLQAPDNLHLRSFLIAGVFTSVTLGEL